LLLAQLDDYISLGIRATCLGACIAIVSECPKILAFQDSVIDQVKHFGVHFLVSLMPVFTITAMCDAKAPGYLG
jgi:hypothetical protein